MNNEQIYWFVTTIQDITNPNILAMRTWGFYLNEEDAIEDLACNYTDMNEGVYQYAVIEPYRAGGPLSYAFELSRFWFKYDAEKDGYFAMNEPEQMKHYFGFAFG